jgi:hypothetical protein
MSALFNGSECEDWNQSGFVLSEVWHPSLTYLGRCASECGAHEINMAKPSTYNYSLAIKPRYGLFGGVYFIIKHNIDRGRTVTDNKELGIPKRTAELQRDFNATHKLPFPPL